MTITISDPWDLVTEVGSGPFQVYPIAPMSQDGDRLLCVLRHPLRYKSVRFSYVVIQAHHAGITLADEDHEHIPCSISSLADHEGKSQLMDDSIPSQQRVVMIGSFEPQSLD